MDVIDLGAENLELLGHGSGLPRQPGVVLRHGGLLPQDCLHLIPEELLIFLCGNLRDLP